MVLLLKDCFDRQDACLKNQNSSCHAIPPSALIPVKFTGQTGPDRRCGLGAGFDPGHGFTGANC